MRNTMAMWLARQLGIAWANDIVPCDVTFNGHDLGAFMLTGKIGINGASVDIDETQGILLELSDDYDEKYKFRSATYNLPVMVKDPDFDELAEDDPAWGTRRKTGRLESRLRARRAPGGRWPRLRGI